MSAIQVAAPHRLRIINNAVEKLAVKSAAKMRRLEA